MKKTKTIRRFTALKKYIKAHPFLSTGAITSFFWLLIFSVLKLIPWVYLIICVLVFIAGAIISWDWYTYMNKPKIDKLVSENKALKEELKCLNRTPVPVKPQSTSATYARKTGKIIPINTVSSPYSGKQE